MDWGFTDVLDYNGNTYRAACFAYNLSPLRLVVPSVHWDDRCLSVHGNAQSRPDRQYEKRRAAQRSGGASGLAERLRGLHEGS